MPKRSLSALILILILFAALGVTQAPPAPKLRPIQQDGKWGYIDATGKVVIQPQFNWAEEFSEGLAAFETDEGHYGYIDETGKVVIEPILNRWSPFTEGLAAVSVRLLEWGYIDRNGAWVIKPQFQYARPFKDGFAAVELRVEKDGVLLMSEKRSTIIDRTGKAIIAPVPYVLNNQTSNGIAFLQNVHTSPIGGVDARNLLIDKNGKVIFDGEDIELDGFSEGLTPVKKAGKWGYIDVTGAFLIEPRFTEAKSFSEGLAAVKVGNKWGYIDRTGKLVLSAKFAIDEIEDERSAFSEGMALVYLGNEKVFIDKAGKIVLRPKISEAERFIGGLALVRNTYQNGTEERGYINKQGKFLWGPKPFRYKSNDDIRAQIKKREEKEGTGEKLEPLTDEERKTDYRNLVASQPDFTAEISYFRSHYVSGSGFGYKLTRKGNRFRKESQFWTFVGETGKSRARLNPDKTYNDLEGVDYEAPGSASDFNPKLLATDPDNVFSPLGRITIDGHECIKVSVQRKGREGRKEELYLYLAKGLKNLAIVAQLRDSNSTLIQRLENISLDVSEASVQIPPDYKPMERDLWRKVENATVRYGGKESKDYGVFRSPTGELFVWIKDAKYPWEYLLHPNVGFVETAFEGLLVTRTGEYVWRTNETEALSPTYYRTHAYIERVRKDAKPLGKRSNSFRFQSNDSKDIWIEVAIP